MAAWTADIGFVLDRLEQLNASDASGRFKGRLDMTRVGVFGHSFGGAQAAQFCSDDPRCKAGIDTRRQLAVTTYCLYSFFDAHLKGAGVPLRISSPLYPEIQVLD